LGKKVEEKVIKPQLYKSQAENYSNLTGISSQAAIPKRFCFHPDNAHGCSFLCGFLFPARHRSVNYPSATQLISDWLLPVSLWTAIINLIWLIPTLIAIPPYFSSIEYSVKLNPETQCLRYTQKEHSHDNSKAPAIQNHNKHIK